MRLYTAEDPEGHRWMFGQPPAIATSKVGSMAGAYILNLPGLTPYADALELQQSLAAAVSRVRCRTRCSCSSTSPS